MGEFIRFRLIGRTPKTKIWKVVTTAGNDRLGVIKWYCYWRRYRFYPDGGTGYDAICMHEIGDFLDKQMRIHKRKRALEREAEKRRMDR